MTGKPVSNLNPRIVPAADCLPDGRALPRMLSRLGKRIGALSQIRLTNLKDTHNGLTVSRRNTFYIRHGKRILDVLVASVGLIVTSPVLGICAIAIRLDSFGPILFRQWRVGEHGLPFQILKLRTMVLHADVNGPQITAAGDCRITRVGKWLRKTKLDEVPQLINVLRGEMSLVGPRPEVPLYVATYTDEQKKLLEFKPGITGPASLGFIDEEQLLASDPGKENLYVTNVLPSKLEIDLAYCQSISFLGDVTYVLGTIGKLLIPSKHKKGESQA